MRTRRAKVGLLATAVANVLMAATIVGRACTAQASIPPLNVPIERAELDAQVRVRLDTINDAFSLSGMNLRFSGAAASAGTSALGYRAVRVSWKPAGDGLVAWTVVDRDSGAIVVQVKAAKFEAAGSGLRLNLKSIPARIVLAPTVAHGPRAARTIDLIAHLPLEEYVRGVLPAEMPSGWPIEALKAQAIAARTFALFRVRAREESRSAFDVEATVMDQMYLLPEANAVPSEHLASIERAVRETRGLLLSTGGASPQPLAAYFHADCGGHTEDARAVWGTAGSGTTTDEGCPLNPHAVWTARLTAEEIGKHLHAKSRLARLEAIGRSETDRVERMRLVWADGLSTELSAHEFRMALGHEKVKSTNFAVSRSGADYILSGKGFGHGVGLCQWGARHLAKGGKSYREILAHYYPRSRLTDLATLMNPHRDLAANGASPRH